LLKRPTDIPAAWKKDVLTIGSQTAFDLNSFDQARGRLDALNGIVVPFTVGLNTMSDRIDDYRRRWDAEQRIRARETAANDLPRVKLVTTKGEITAELFKNEAPVTTANFLRLADEKLYDGQSIFFRNDSQNRHMGFQFGANATDGGQKDSSIVGERTSRNRRDLFRGSLCMLDVGQPASGTRFIIAFVPITDAEIGKRFTVFGRVIDGYDVLDRFDSEQTLDKNKNPKRVEKVTIVRR
jgi:cyclophilin family peptidyl-prolyl cis-trans isomerase